ncbi:MAG: hypothetical protein E4H32_03730 [Nitrospirales bacterium]|nr:MAG: hypothetical protein E4H32_03730 [Nitrospirales bacterium]
MVRLLRQLRESALSKPNFIRYVSYALGEIILIAVGILIAVQIDDWNESRNMRKLEINALEAIAASLEESTNNLEDNRDAETRWLGYNQLILDHLDTCRPYSPELDQAFGSYFWTSKAELAVGAYEQLKSHGLSLISNSEIQRQITYLFEVRFPKTTSENQGWDDKLIISAIYPEHVKLFRKYYPEDWSVLEDEYARPIDYPALCNNETFKNILAEIIGLRQFNIATTQRTLQEIQELNLAIVAELKRINS